MRGRSGAVARASSASGTATLARLLSIVTMRLGMAGRGLLLARLLGAVGGVADCWSPSRHRSADLEPSPLNGVPTHRFVRATEARGRAFAASLEQPKKMQRSVRKNHFIQGILLTGILLLNPKFSLALI